MYFDAFAKNELFGKANFLFGQACAKWEHASALPEDSSRRYVVTTAGPLEPSIRDWTEYYGTIANSRPSAALTKVI